MPAFPTRCAVIPDPRTLQLRGRTGRPANPGAQRGRTGHPADASAQTKYQKPELPTPGTSLRIILLLLLVVLLSCQDAFGQGGRSTGLPVPRFVSLGSDRVNVRFGPGKQYPINWIYARKDLPVTIVAEFDTWRKIRDHEGEEGWVHSGLLSSKRTIMVKDKVTALRRTPDENARIVLRAEPGVIGQLFACEENWCHVEVAGQRGWLKRDEFWGALPGEIIH